MDETGTRHNISLSSQKWWECFVEFILAEVYLLEIDVSFLFFGDVKHVLTYVKSNNISKPFILETLSDKSSCTGEINNFCILFEAENFGELFNVFCTFFWVRVTSSEISTFIVFSQLVEMLLSSLLVVLGELLKDCDVVKAEFFLLEIE